MKTWHVEKNSVDILKAALFKEKDVTLRNIDLHEWAQV